MAKEQAHKLKLYVRDSTDRLHGLMGDAFWNVQALKAAGATWRRGWWRLPDGRRGRFDDGGFKVAGGK